MPRFVGLEGVAGGVIETDEPHARSVTAFLKGLTATNRVVSGASDHGAITVWRDDTGMYRAAYCRFMVTRSSITVGQKKTLKTWLKKWVPVMHGAAS